MTRFRVVLAVTWNSHGTDQVTQRLTQRLSVRVHRQTKSGNERDLERMRIFIHLLARMFLQGGGSYSNSELKVSHTCLVAMDPV